jgi:uncharacterized protein (TIGR02147 family)
MDGQIAFQKLLIEKLEDIRLRKPGFSLRAFSQKVGLSPPEVSLILRGKRKATLKMVSKVSRRLLLSPIEIESLTRAFEKPTSETSSEKSSEKNALRPRLAVELNMDHFKVISDWYHFALLSLAETKDFSSDPAWLARRLNLRVPQVKEALGRLERLGMLERTEEGRLQPTGLEYTTSDEIANVSLRKSHSQDLELAQRSLENDALSDRDFTAMTMAIDPEKIPEAKKMIREFRDRLSAFLESGSKKEIYKVCFQLFPLTRLENNHE